MIRHWTQLWASRFAAGLRRGRGSQFRTPKVLLRLLLQALLRPDKRRQLQDIGACPASHRTCVLTGTVSSVLARWLQKLGVRARIDAPTFDGNQVGCTTRQQCWHPERAVSGSLSLPCGQYSNGYALFLYLSRESLARHASKVTANTVSRKTPGRTPFVFQRWSLSAFSSPGIIRATGPFQNTEVGPSFQCACGAYKIASSHRCGMRRTFRHIQDFNFHFSLSGFRGFLSLRIGQ